MPGAPTHWGEIHRTLDGEEWSATRGWVIERVFSHDVYHCSELSETLGRAGLAQIDVWE